MCDFGIGLFWIWS